MNGLIKATAALGATLLAVSATAQEPLTYDRVDLTAGASIEIEQDLLIAIVFAEVEDNDQSDAADAVNTAISWAADQARRVDGIEIETTNYSTRPLYANGRRITGWVARQGLRLESEDAEALSELLGVLQERVAIQSINYGVSPEAREQASETLIGEALAQFNRRAALIANELGRAGFRIVRINVLTPGNDLVRMERMAAMDERMEMSSFSAPAIQAGSDTLTVTVAGQIELDAAE